jgi:transposase-like protein
MSVKRKTYSAEFKAKLVLEALEGEKTINVSLYFHLKY